MKKFLFITMTVIAALIGACQYLNKYTENQAENPGIDKYNKGLYCEALADFEAELKNKSLSRKQKLDVQYCAALAAFKCGNNRKADKYFKIILKAEYGKSDSERVAIFRNYASMFEKDDPDKALKILIKAKKKYPDDKDILIQIINIYITENKLQDARGYLLDAIEKDCGNKFLFYNLAIILSNEGRNMEAIDAYNKAIAIDSMYFDAYYNLGALYYNDAVEINKRCIDIPVKNQSGYYACMDSLKSRFIEALPYLQKAYEINPQDLNTVLSLKTLYLMIGNTEGHEDMDRVYKSLKSYGE
ncbi:MAG: tetratricopeptide repeat protein [Bacteroidota bacterium]